jgi:DNA-binding transcriptional ArsR family regulator
MVAWNDTAAAAADDAAATSCAAATDTVTYNHMVARQRLSDAEIDRVFRALADATRRDIVARVMGGEGASISALAARYEMSFAAVQKHVAVLEGAGLVTKETQGRERIVRGNPERVARARDLLARLEGLWRARFSQLDSVLSTPNTQE